MWYGEVTMMTKLPLDAGEPGALSQLQVRPLQNTTRRWRWINCQRSCCVKHALAWAISCIYDIFASSTRSFAPWIWLEQVGKAISEALFLFHCISAAPVAPAVSIQCHRSHPQEGTAHGWICGANMGLLWWLCFWLHHQTTWMLKFRDTCTKAHWWLNQTTWIFSIHAYASCIHLHLYTIHIIIILYYIIYIYMEHIHTDMLTYLWCLVYYYVSDMYNNIISKNRSHVITFMRPDQRSWPIRMWQIWWRHVGQDGWVDSKNPSEGNVPFPQTSGRSIAGLSRATLSCEDWSWYSSRAGTKKEKPGKKQGALVDDGRGRASVSGFSTTFYIYITIVLL